MLKYAPIALFVYDRPAVLRQTVERLKSNMHAKDSELFIFSDAPKDKTHEAGVKEVREYIKTINGFKNVLIREHKINKGPSRSIIEGVSELIAGYGRVIVLEDDLVVSQYFLKFMNEALSFYENEPKVMSINGYMYPVDLKDRETLFLRVADCWGWATWKRGWDLLETDAFSIMKKLKDKKMIGRLDLEGACDYSKMLEKKAGNKISSWAICWYASSLLNNKLSLYPARSLVRNVGFDGKGTHCTVDTGFNVDMLEREFRIAKIPVEEDKDAIRKIKTFFRISRVKKLWNRFFGRYFNYA